MAAGGAVMRDDVDVGQTAGQTERGQAAGGHTAPPTVGGRAGRQVVETTGAGRPPGQRALPAAHPVLVVGLTGQGQVGIGRVSEVGPVQPGRGGRRPASTPHAHRGTRRVQGAIS